MIIIQVVGGIGNQIFQYIFGQYLSVKHNQIVVYDLRYYTSKAPRRCELQLLDSNLITYKVNKLLDNKLYRISYQIWKFIFQLKLNNTFIDEKYFNKSESFRFYSQYNYYLQGYWQETKYADYLQPLFIFKNIETRIISGIVTYKREINKEEQSVCLHIRRGDYFQPQNIHIYGVCNAEYYQKGIKYISEHVSGSRFFIFSDDLDWVKQHIHIPDNAIYIENLNTNHFSYIYLMSLCKHNIISNSSFSWWGAYLNTNDAKIVVCPSQWTLVSEDTLALESWIKI